MLRTLSLLLLLPLAFLPLSCGDEDDVPCCVCDDYGFEQCISACANQNEVNRNWCKQSTCADCALRNDATRCWAVCNSACDDWANNQTPKCSESCGENMCLPAGCRGEC